MAQQEFNKASPKVYFFFRTFSPTQKGYSEELIIKKMLDILTVWAGSLSIIWGVFLGERIIWGAINLRRKNIKIYSVLENGKWKIWKYGLWHTKDF